MYVFLSYAREDRELAENIRAALGAAGFDCFLDTKSLPPGQEYNARIGRAVDRADLFIFLLSAAALEPGSYALTELSFAEKKWRNPAGHVLPVAPAGFALGSLPAYLRPINVLTVRGNPEAEVVAWVRERVERGGGGGEETPEERLHRWKRLHQPPLRRARRLPLRYVAFVPFGILFIAFGLFAASFVSSSRLRPPGPEGVDEALTLIPIVVGALAILVGIVHLFLGLAGARPRAALVLDRNEDKSGVRVHLLFADGTRKPCAAVGRAATRAYPGELGWAFARGGMLLDFERG